MTHTLTDIWPIFGLRVRLGDLELRPVSDGDLPELVALVLDGIHDTDRMPFSTPWTDAPREALPANYVRHYWEVRSRTTPERWSIDLVVRRAGEVVGVQGVSTQDFLVTRTGETGSWLGQRFQGQGIGTRMRQAMCALAFDHLGFEEVTSAAFLDNPASLAVSRRVGYVPNGDVRMKRRPDECAVNRGLLLTPEAFTRPDAPVEVEGAAAVRVFLGIDAALAAATP
jgi:RimJ/RimL family protein N-acetyltransferase